MTDGLLFRAETYLRSLCVHGCKYYFSFENGYIFSVVKNKVAFFINGKKLVSNHLKVSLDPSGTTVYFRLSCTTDNTNYLERRWSLYDIII